jgi:type VI secretion system protein ImpE
MGETEGGAGALFRAGHLDKAVEAASAAVRKAPADIGPRVLLCEFLLFAGNYERADKLLDAASQIDPEAAVVVAEFRQLLRADLARRQLRTDGRLPEFLGAPTEAMAAMLEAYVALRSGDAAQAGKLAERAESLRPRVAGSATASSTADFEDFRDTDDMTAGFFEVLTTTGKYFWIATERVESIEFHAPRRARDLFWRRVSMSVREGPDGDVYIPVTYGRPAHGDDGAPLGDEYRLGRATDWTQPDVGPVRGIGQRAYLAGDELISVMDLKTIAFRDPNVAS